MATSSVKPVDVGRRLWLARASRGAAGAAAAVSSGVAAAPTAPEPPLEPAPQPSSRGYRETDRVRRYYQLARF